MTAGLPGKSGAVPAAAILVVPPCAIALRILQDRGFPAIWFAGNVSRVEPGSKEMPWDL